MSMKEKILEFVKDLHTRYKFTAKYGEYESVEFVPEEECSKPFNKPKILGCNEVLDSN